MLGITAYSLAQRFVGIKEISGGLFNPQIMTMLKLDNEWPENDEVPWCSAFVNYIAWLLRLPRTKSLQARSWLTVGIPKKEALAKIGFDIVVVKTGENQPGPEVIDAPGHVGFYAGEVDAQNKIHILGGNQSNSVKISIYDKSDILGVRRLLGD